MTLAELAAKSGVTTEKIASYTQAGLLPCKDEKTTYTDKDLYGQGPVLARYDYLFCG
ncbi:MerR family transcriptional regulator [Secundilactobacillus paracollinoides]|uniref:MerR family transcriptional regulator n=1 Tax=Secundilactobacillus paracollinoides TaxID=240427 RepID=UPI0006EEF8A5|nr:MerR family transcriptional regulator [Secundilactobacillus paracollinoides]KRL79908.1 hypothetical protein FC17_GL000149 [Secundilactobacillus paracollinoides DSM 15502 = JCM 11969]